MVLDTSGIDAVSAGFVRGDPPDIALNNYNQETARFIQRCAMSDLSDTEAAQSVREDLTPFMDQFGVCPGRTSAIPYSIMGAAVIYNKEIFEQNDLEVPTTWDELIDVCETLEAAGVTPFYATFADNWTIGQGWYDYTVGGMLDTVAFFEGLAEEGADVGPNSAVSFQKDQAEPVDKMLELSQYVNSDASSRTYGDGNTAMANGEAAMYMQGPWAFGEIAKAAPDLELGMFPLPVTDDPDDLKARINMDLAAWIPEASRAPGSGTRVPRIPLPAGGHPGVQRVAVGIRADQGRPTRVGRAHHRSPGVHRRGRRSTRVRRRSCPGRSRS